MKKIVKLSIIIAIMTMCIMGTVYATFSCNVTMQASITETSKNEEFTIDIDLVNIESERGVISLGATLEYDNESLELVKMEGKNEWETPSEGTSYNANNGKIAVTRNGLGKNDETIFTITFRVKEESKQNLVVTLKNITVADGTAPTKIERVYQNITVTDGTPNPIPEPGADDSSNANSSKNTVTNSSNKNSITNKFLPNTGSIAVTILIVAIIVLVLVALSFLIKIKIIDKKIEK